MPLSTYNALAWAIENRLPLACAYEGHHREICPIILGHSDGREKVLVYQTGGSTSRGPLRKPDWKCFEVSGIGDIEPLDGPWQIGGRHSQTQTCVRDVDYDVNEASPYDPRHSLGRLSGAAIEGIGA